MTSINNLSNKIFIKFIFLNNNLTLRFMESFLFILCLILSLFEFATCLENGPRENGYKTITKGRFNIPLRNYIYPGNEFMYRKIESIYPQHQKYGNKRLESRNINEYDQNKIRSFNEPLLPMDHYNGFLESPMVNKIKDKFNDIFSKKNNTQSTTQPTPSSNRSLNSTKYIDNTTPATTNDHLNCLGAFTSSISPNPISTCSPKPTPPGDINADSLPEIFSKFSQKEIDILKQFVQCYIKHKKIIDNLKLNNEHLCNSLSDNAERAKLKSLLYMDLFSYCKSQLECTNNNCLNRTNIPELFSLDKMDLSSILATTPEASIKPSFPTTKMTATTNSKKPSTGLGCAATGYNYTQKMTINMILGTDITTPISYKNNNSQYKNLPSDKSNKTYTINLKNDYSEDHLHQSPYNRQNNNPFVRAPRMLSPNLKKSAFMKSKSNCRNYSNVNDFDHSIEYEVNGINSAQANKIQQNTPIKKSIDDFDSEYTEKNDNKKKLRRRKQKKTQHQLKTNRNFYDTTDKNRESKIFTDKEGMIKRDILVQRIKVISEKMRSNPNKYYHTKSP